MGPDGYVRKKVNKNRTSTRIVPIMIPQLHTALNAVKDKNGPVVTQTSNVLLDDTKRACEKAGVTICTYHDLRRTFASLCYYLRIPEKQIQQWGGWKDTTTLEKVYIKLSTIGTNESKNAFTNHFKKYADGSKKDDSNQVLKENNSKYYPVSGINGAYDLRLSQ